MITITIARKALNLATSLQNGYYVSFPETIESIFYSHRITGGHRWLEYNWEIFQALERESNATVPYASIIDIERPDSFVNYLPGYDIASPIN